PLDPLSLLATAFSSSLVLGDSIRIMLTDKLGRQFAQAIPIPAASADNIQPPKLQLATSNAIEGPFGVGKEIRVGVQAEPGLIATFNVGKLHQGMPLHEQEPGKYIGSWVVPEKETNQHIIPMITLINPDSRSKLEWDIPGVIEIDTTAPSSLFHLQATPLQGAIKITWESKDLPASIASFVVQRADEKGIFQTISKPSLTAFADKNIVLGQHYHYQVYAIDKAGNKGSISEINMMAIKPGPNALSGDLKENYSLSEYGSPYIIDGALNILSAAKLLVGEGVIIQMNANSQINVFGGMIVSGTEDKPVQIEGSNMHINFQGGQSSLNHLIVQSIHSTMKISASVKMTHTSIIETRQLAKEAITNSEQQASKSISPSEQADTGIVINGHAQVLLDDVLLQGQHTGIAMNSGQLQLKGVRFLMHDTALKVTGDSHIRYVDLIFDKNTIHVDSTIPLVFKRHYFVDKGFEKLVSKVRGQASIDWADPSRVSNDLDHWMINTLKKLTRTLSQKGMEETVTQAFAMQSTIKNNKTTYIAETLQAIHTGISPKNQRSVEALKGFFSNHFIRDKNIHYWIQEQRISINAAFSNSEEYLYHQADEKINTAYLRNRFPNTSPIKLRRSSKAFDCKKYTPLNILLADVKTKKHTKVWVLRGTYDNQINRYLVKTGLIKRPLSDIHVALLGEANARANWLGVMRSQNIQSKDIGNGEMNKQLFIDAKKLNFDFVLRFSIQTKQQPSSLSTTLHRITGVLNVAVYDVKNKLKIEIFSKRGRASGFSQAEAEKKIVNKTLHQIQPDLIAFLIKQDNLAKRKHQ
ncbi:MAG: hypothetical protein Q9M14_04650, partial [Mariprofundaceae bacterium]|nr:hypothetical protein [Mariprofundaceae bacterium]